MAAVQTVNELMGVKPFDIHGEPTSVGQRWRRWIRSFELYKDGKGIQNADQAKALLLHCGGTDLQDVYFTFPAREPDVDNNETVYTVVKAQLENYFTPRVNVSYERHLFRGMAQQPSESVDQYVTRLRQRADFCDFGDNVNDQIKDQVIEKCLSNHLRRKLLERGRDLTLAHLQTLARAMETSERQATNMAAGGQQSQSVNFVKSGARPKQHKQQHDKTDMRCYRCDNTGHISSDSKCPARDVECTRCKKVGHYMKCCKTKMKQSGNKKYGKKHSKSRVRLVNEDSDSDYAFSVGEKHEAVKIEADIGGVSTSLIIDSGATCNVISEKEWERLKANKIKCESRKSAKRLYPYGSKSPLEVLGSFSAEIKVRDKTLEASFTVVKGEGQNLLGEKTATALDVLRVGFANSIETVGEPETLVEKYKDRFEGLGKLKDFQLHIPINKEVQPVAQSVRPVPFSLRTPIENKLDELTDLDIVEKAEGPTPWVSPIVVVPKTNGDLRICVDMRRANEAIERERHPIPTVDEVIHDLNQSTVFSKLDLKWAFHQIELDEESREITTFVTHRGLYRYKRLMFGVSCAPEMYQRIIQQALHGCKGVRNIFDDIVVHGSTKEEHDENLEGLLIRLREKGLTLNREKCKFHLDQLEFMGHLLSSKGISPHSGKVEAVKDARQPESASEVRSFLGLVNFCARFIPNLATISEPLRRLTKKDQEFVWGLEQDNAFKELKSKLTTAETLGYFDTKAKTCVITDASPVGLGAVLTQEQNGVNRVICYASRSLTDVEKRYSQTEKEALGIVWACERFNMYLYGIDFELHTDHKPLEFIYSSKSKPSARINRWVLRLQPYTFKVKHIPGKSNIADCLSRLTTPEGNEKVKDSEEYIRFVAQHSTPKAMSTREIERESAKDPELSRVRGNLRNNCWKKKEDRAYQLIKDELCVIGKLVLRGTRIIIPETLRGPVLDIAHEGHPGIVAQKRRMRTKVWWPGIDRDIEKSCKTCRPCQIVGMPSPPEPVKSTELPSGPWQQISADLMGPLPSGDNLFVVVDYYSRYVEVEIMKSTTADNIIKRLKKIFLTHGLPISITTDNGPQFISDQFKAYLEDENIEHRKVTPLWPQANGEVERQNRSLLKRLKIAQVEKKDWREELSSYLMMYRTTPHSVTGVCPAELLFKRKLRTRLPGLGDEPIEDFEVRDRDTEQKAISKEYADSRRNAKESEIENGDEVLMKQKHQNKLSATFESQPYRVIEKNGNSVEVERDGTKYRRNSSHFKKLQSDPKREREREQPVERERPYPVERERFSEREQSYELEPKFNDVEIVEPDPDIEQLQNDEPRTPGKNNMNLDNNYSKPSRRITLPSRFKDFDMS